MLFELLKIKNYIPYKTVKRVQDIDFEALYESGKRVVLSDLDNTLISYAYSTPNQEMTDFVRHLEEIGFEVVIVSNSPASRVSKFLEALNVKGVALARKPLKIGMNQALSSIHRSKDEMVFLGDQLMTDVLVGNRLGIDTYLVEAIERKSEKWYTRFNRRLERFVVKKIKKKHLEEYQEKLGERYGL